MKPVTGETFVTEAEAAEKGYRRRFPRRQFHRQVGCLTMGTYFFTHGVEIGEGGMRIETPEKIPQGSNVVINFFLPGSEFITATAEIVYGSEVQSTAGNLTYGMKFLKLAFESKRLIRDYIAAKKAEEAA